MKLYVASDLHVEYSGKFYLPKEGVDVVVLAGDIHQGDCVLDVAIEYQKHCNAPVIVVAGNHEYYGSDIKTRLPALRKKASDLNNIHFLENDCTVINDVRFLGCTLWTNFSLYGTRAIGRSKAIAQKYIPDFDIIYYGGKRFRPDDAAAEFQNSYRWLEHELSKPFSGKTVVVTHFLPHRAGIHPMHLRRGGDELTPYFTADCAALMQSYPIDAWLYGHTHNSVDTVVEDGTRLVSNQCGYPDESRANSRFDPEKIIEI